MHWREWGSAAVMTASLGAAFHESVRGGWYILPEVAAVAVMAAAVLALARSPLLADAAEET